MLVRSVCNAVLSIFTHTHCLTCTLINCNMCTHLCVIIHKIAADHFSAAHATICMFPFLHNYLQDFAHISAQRKQEHGSVYLLASFISCTSNNGILCSLFRRASLQSMRTPNIWTCTLINCNVFICTHAHSIFACARHDCSSNVWYAFLQSTMLRHIAFMNVC